VGKVSVEIICTACGADTFVRREPEYDGFVKKGEKFICGSCGHKYASEAEVPFKQKKSQSIFGEGDKLKKVEIFRSDEAGKNCRHCTHYVVNPFTQRCGLHDRVVQATDICGDFEKSEEGKDMQAQSPEGTDGESPAV
jgi:hypothetical protein